MSLVRANWEPISKRYLQQAEGAKDPALASSLYGSVAEFHLKYRPADGEGETYLRRSLELDPHNRRSGNHFERVLREKGSNDELLTLYTQRADRAANRDERALAEVAAGELCDKMNRPVDAYTHLPQGAGREPGRAARAARRARRRWRRQQEWAELGKVLEGAARSKRGEQDVTLLIDLATLIWKRLESARHGGVVLPPRAQAGRLEPRDGRVLSRVLHREERAAPAADGPRAGAEDRRRRRAPGRDGDRDGARRGGSARSTPRRRSRSGRGSCASSRTCPRRSTSLRALYTRTEKWNALLELLKDDLDAVPAGERRRKDQALPGDRRDLSRSLEPRRDGGEHLPQRSWRSSRITRRRWRRWRRATRRRGATATWCRC